MLKYLKNRFRAAVRNFGYDIMPLREVRDRDFAIHLKQLFKFLKIDCVFDVGANTGQYRDFLRNRVLYDGTIISFEPIAQHVEHLRAQSRSDPKWLVKGYALGREKGRMSINIMKSDQFSSFLSPDNSRIPAFSALNEPARTEIVDVRTLDEVLPNLQREVGFDRLYLKLDTQGFDIEALQGGGKVLPSIPALQTEASVIGIYRNMPDYRETIDFLNHRGFDVTGFYTVSRDHLFRVIEFDCVMVNRALAASAS